MKNYLVYIIAVLSGAAGVLAFSPFDLWGFAYLSLFGLIFIAKTPKKSTALWATFLWALTFLDVYRIPARLGVYRFSVVTIRLYAN